MRGSGSGRGSIRMPIAATWNSVTNANATRATSAGTSTATGPWIVEGTGFGATSSAMNGSASSDPMRRGTGPKRRRKIERNIPST